MICMVLNRNQLKSIKVWAKIGWRHLQCDMTRCVFGVKVLEILMFSFFMCFDMFLVFYVCVMIVMDEECVSLLKIITRSSQIMIVEL